MFIYADFENSMLVFHLL